MDADRPVARRRAERRILLTLPMIFRLRGGIPRFNQMLCRALDELAPALDVRGTVLSIHDTADMYAAHDRAWRHLEFVPCGSNLGTVRKTLGVCLAGRVDAMLIGLLGMSPLGLIASPFLRRGFGVIVHGTEAWDHVPATRRLPLKRARYVFSVSRFTADALCRGTGFDPARVRILHNTLAPEFEPMPDGDHPGPSGTDTGPPELLSVGRLWAIERQKGIDTTLRAVAKLSGRHPGLRYRIVGKGDDAPRLKALASTLGLGERAVFEQDLTDTELADRYRNCTIFVLPSGQEGFGIVFLEAMRFGKPCIGGSPGGSAEVIDRESTGLIVPFGDEEALIAAIDRLLRDAALRRRMGEAGRRRLSDHFLYARFRDTVDMYMRAWLDES